ncbi:MAG: DUF1292 domain-containing protein [Clostridia bacterium]|nr:DUF1292 domain-containing protein [Clostridia bacterium]
MDNEFTSDIITLLDDEGNEHEFEVLDVLEQDDRVFLALVPSYNSPEELVEDSSIYYIFEQIEDENKDLLLVEIEDEDLLDSLAEIFENRFEAFYENEENDSESND